MSYYRCLKNHNSEASAKLDRHKLWLVDPLIGRLWLCLPIQQSRYCSEYLIRINEAYAILCPQGTTPSAMRAAWAARQILLEHDRFEESEAHRLLPG